MAKQMWNGREGEGGSDESLRTEEMVLDEQLLHRSSFVLTSIHCRRCDFQEYDCSDVRADRVADYTGIEDCPCCGGFAEACSITLTSSRLPGLRVSERNGRRTYSLCLES